MDIFSDLKERGLVYQTSNEAGVKNYLSQSGNSFYVGFDPTAPSLHVGNLLHIVLAKRLEKIGLKPVILVGGATGLIGDPSGKSKERPLASEKLVKESGKKIEKEL